MSDIHTIEADDLFRPHHALKQEHNPLTPISAANSKKAELWSDGSKFYFMPVSSPGAVRKYPRIKFFSERPAEISPCTDKEAFLTEGLIADFIVTEVIHDGHYFYVWNLEAVELREVLYGEQTAA